MTTEEMMSTTAVNTWKLVIGRFSKGLAPLTDEQLQQQVRHLGGRTAQAQPFQPVEIVRQHGEQPRHLANNVRVVEASNGSAHVVSYMTLVLTTPEGQAVMQAMQPRQLSICRRKRWSSGASPWADFFIM